MKYTFYIFFFFVFLAPELRGQQINNLVPNGNFNIDSCFYPRGSIWKTSNWNAAIQNQWSSSDIILDCQYARWPALMNSLNLDSLMDNEGGAAGIGLRTDFPFYREYIQSILETALERDSFYVVELSILATYKKWQLGLFVNRLEVLFSSAEVSAPLINGYIPGRIGTAPSLVYEGAFLNDTANWTTIKFTYKAKGDEKWLVIGNFSPDSLIGTQIVNDGYPGTYKWAYYLIDDVMVYKASDTIKKQPEPILPNVFSPNQDGVNEFYAIENLPENSSLEVYNRWGSLVFTQAPYQNNWPGNAPNGQPLPDGVYFAILSYQDAQGKVQQQKQTVHIFR